MPRPRLLPVVVGLLIVLGPSGIVDATTPPTPPTSTVPASGVPGSTTLPGSAPPSTIPGAPTTVPLPTVPLPTIPRAGSSIGGLRRDTGTSITLARAATLVTLAIAGLALAGYVFGRIRSAPPRRVTSTALARRD